MIEDKIYTAEQIIADLQKQKEALEQSSKSKMVYVINPADKENFEKITGLEYGRDFIVHEMVSPEKVIVYSEPPSRPEINYSLASALNDEVRIDSSMNRAQRRAAMKEQKKRKKVGKNERIYRPGNEIQNNRR